ncbi:hypothetical protein FS837_002341 [Tulasnella sp. UAMH 9824]|nr:hypothetical protein FS837_002341 [Tulasnella sp. UAMH 9824]
MESYKKPIKAALSNLKNLTRNKTKLKNAVSSITQSLDDLFKLTPADRDSETSRVQSSITKAFNVNIIPLYEAHPRDALELAASLINAIYYTHISSYLTSDTPGCDGQLSWERVVDLGVLEAIRPKRKLRCSTYFGYRIPSKVVKSDNFPLKIANSSAKNCIRYSAQWFIVNNQETFEQALEDRPRASAPLLREAYLKKLSHNLFGVETFGPKATRQLYQIISDAKDSNMPQGDGTIGLMEVPLSTVLELQVLRPQAEITLNLSEPPIVVGEMMQLPAESLPPYVAQFTIRKSELPRNVEKKFVRVSGGTWNKLITNPPGFAVLGRHSSAGDVNTPRSPLRPIPDGLKLQYQESSLGTIPCNDIAPRSLLERRDGIQASGNVDLLASPNCSDNGPNRRLSQLRPSNNLQVTLSENLSSISTPMVETSSLASAELNGGTRELLPTAHNDEASLVSLRLAGRKWGAGRAASNRAKVQDKAPQAEGIPSGPKGAQVKDTISDTTPLIERQPSERGAPRNEFLTDVFGTGPSLSNLEANRLAQADITKSKDLDPCLESRDFPGSPHPRPLAAVGLPRARVKPHDIPLPRLDDIVHPPFPLLNALPEQVTSLTTIPELTTLDDRIQHTTEMPGKLWSFNVKATLSSPKGPGATGARSGTEEHCPSTAQADPCHVDPIVTTPRSLFSPQVTPRTSDQHVPPTPSAITTSVKAPRKALLSPRKRYNTSLQAMESFSQLKNQPKPLDCSHQIPVSAERKRVPGVSIVGQRPESHSSPNDCEEILKVLEKIQTRVAEGLCRKFQGARQEVRTARDFVFQQARADLDYIRQQSISGQASLGNVANNLTVQRRDLEQRYMFVMKRDISTAVGIKKIVQQHDRYVGSSSSSKPTSLFGGKGTLLLKMGFAIPGTSMN